jgi:hypothetical protein
VTPARVGALALALGCVLGTFLSRWCACVGVMWELVS